MFRFMVLLLCGFAMCRLYRAGIVDIIDLLFLGTLIVAADVYIGYRMRRRRLDD